MSKSGRVAGAMGSPEHELAALEGHRLGLVACFSECCGGGRTLSKFAAIATHGKVYGIDHSTESVAMALRTNPPWVDLGRVEVQQASVSRLPFADGVFDAITAVETHFWWPALPTDLRKS